MANSTRREASSPQVLDVVALLSESAAGRLARRQVGTVVERLDAFHFLVEFSDDNGVAYALEPIEASQLLVLQYEAA